MDYVKVIITENQEHKYFNERNKMEAKDFLEEIDYYNTNVEGQLYEELGIETLADMFEVYHQRKLKLLGIADVSKRYSEKEVRNIPKIKKEDRLNLNDGIK